MSDDYAASTETTGRVTVGGTAAGAVEVAGDRDWYAVELRAGWVYNVEVRGFWTGDGTLGNPHLYGIHDAGGDVIAGTQDADSGVQWNSRLKFTAPSDGTYYVAAGAGSGRGTYEVGVTRLVGEQTGVDAGSTRASAGDLGDLTEQALGGAKFPRGTLDGVADRVDYYRFELTEARDIEFGLRRQETNADLYLEDAEGRVLASSAVSGTTNESLVARLGAGTYYVRVEAREVGASEYVLRYGSTSARREPGSTRESAMELGDITGLEGVVRHRDQVGVHGDDIDYYRFELTEARSVRLGLRAQDAGADLYVEDEAGHVLGSATASGTGDEALTQTLLAGTYFVRVQAQESGRNVHEFSYAVGDADAAEVARLLSARTPAFGESGYAFDLAENADGSTNRIVLGTVAAADPDGDTVSYSLAGGNESGLFTIDASSGEVFYTGSGEDHEGGADPYALTVRASDGEHTTDTTVTVTVTDVAEAPAFGESSYAFALAENADGSTNRIVLGTVAATDPDGDAVSYSLAGGNESGLFTIDASSGEVFYVGSGEDHESGADPYALTVRASDEEHSTDTTVTVTVTDVAEMPAFGESSYAFALAENADGSTNRIVLGTVAATDADEDTVSYSLAGGNESGLFTIDASSGEVFYVGLGEDYESGVGPFELAVQASDGTHTVDTTVTVTVADVAESSGVSEPAGGDLAQDRTTTGVAVVDGGPVTGNIESVLDRDWFAVELRAGQRYVVEQRGRSTDDGTLIDPYLFGLYDASGRRIPGTTAPDGGVDINSRLMFTAPRDGTYYIAAAGNGEEYSGRGTYEVEVRVVPAPVFAQQSYALSVAEHADGSANRIMLGTVAATDEDGDTVSYSLAGGNESGLFTIDASSGEVFYIGSGEDYESDADPYALTVRASDGEHSTDTTVTVTVTDVAEAPAFGESSYAFDLAENADGSTNRIVLGTVAATDPDGGTVSYSLAGGNESGLFTIDASSGEVFYIGSGEDHEGGADPYALTVRASDGQHTTDSTITVTVTDVAEAPAFGESSYAFEIAENAHGGYNGLSLGTVTATDPDGGTLRYSLVDDQEGLFAIDASSGELFYIGMGEDFESGPGPYELTVQASDGADTVDATVTVTVTDVQGSPEPAGGDLPAGRSTTGVVAVNEAPVAGTIGARNDRDWFEVVLAPGRTYEFTVDSGTGGGRSATTPEIRGIRDSSGSSVSGVDSGPTVRFTTDAGAAQATYYVVVGAGSTQGASLGGREWARNAETRSSTGAGDTYRLQGRDVTDHFSAGTSTATTVGVGASVTGEFVFGDGVDWYAVTLEAGKTYRIDLEGSPTGAGTLRDPYLRGVYNAHGIYLPRTTDDDGGRDVNSRVYFTAPEAGTYYVVAGAYGSREGTYMLSVTEVGFSSASDDFTARIDTTGTVSVDGTVSGTIETAYDRDWFAVTLEAGKTYRIDLEGTSTGVGTLRFPSLHGIYDDTGLRVDDFSRSTGGGIGTNSREFFTAAEDGTYYVSVGNATLTRGTYRLSVTDVTESFSDDFSAGTDTIGAVSVGGSTTGNIENAKDNDWFAVTLEAGKTYRIDLEGSPTNAGTLGDTYLEGIHDPTGALIAGTRNDESGTGHNSRMHITPTEDGTYYVSASAYYAYAVGTYKVSVTDVTNSISDDFAVGTDTTGAVSVGGSKTGAIEYVGDRDWFAVTLEAGKLYRIDLEGSATDAGTLRNPYLRGMYDATGDLIGGVSDDNNGTGWNSRVYFRSTEDDTYYISAAGQGSQQGTYTLSVEEITDGM